MSTKTMLGENNMGDMGDIFKAQRESTKQRKDEKDKYYVSLLEKAGAKYVNSATYELDGWLCFTTTGKAMNKKNNKLRTDINGVLRMHVKQGGK